MKCVADIMNQQRIRGKITLFDVGDVHEFDKCPSGWRPIEGVIKDEETGEEKAYTIDFDSATEDELLEGEYDDDDLKAYLLSKYDLKTGNRKREGMVNQLLDARFRELDNVDL